MHLRYYDFIINNINVKQDSGSVMWHNNKCIFYEQYTDGIVKAVELSGNYRITC